MQTKTFTQQELLSALNVQNIKDPIVKINKSDNGIITIDIYDKLEYKNDLIQYFKEMTTSFEKLYTALGCLSISPYTIENILNNNKIERLNYIESENLYFDFKNGKKPYISLQRSSDTSITIVCHIPNNGIAHGFDTDIVDMPIAELENITKITYDNPFINIKYFYNMPSIKCVL